MVNPRGSYAITPVERVPCEDIHESRRRVDTDYLIIAASFSSRDSAARDPIRQKN